MLSVFALFINQEIGLFDMESSQAQAQAQALHVLAARLDPQYRDYTYLTYTL